MLARGSAGERQDADFAREQADLLPYRDQIRVLDAIQFGQFVIIKTVIESDAVQRIAFLHDILLGRQSFSRWRFFSLCGSAQRRSSCGFG